MPATILLAVPPELLEILTFALLNPLTLAIALIMGRSADQPQKILVGGFASALVGMLFVWVLAKLGIFKGRQGAMAGVFVASFLLALVYCWIGHTFLRRRA